MSADSGRSVLEQEIQKLKGELQTARIQPSAPGATQLAPAAAPAGNSGATITSSSVLEQEVARVQAVLAEVIKLIDDPASALSTVMRKNAEKTELESYLKGIRFATGQIEPK